MRGCIIEKDGKGNKKRDATKYACGEPSWFSGPFGGSGGGGIRSPYTLIPSKGARTSRR